MAIEVDSRFLTGAMYAPFCRTAHAPMEEWEKDIRQMAELGYTCLHGFAEWHDIEYEKGHFDFTKVDRLVALCDQYGIKPIINIATQNGVGFYSPRWLMEEYRGVGEGMVDAQGQVMAEAEYVIPCMDDPIYSSYANRYLKAVAQHFAADQRVAAFVLWGEPTLHSPRPNGFKICYCRHTKAKFRVWLQEKYGDIQKLNAAWGTEGPSDYVDFSQVNPPTGLRRQQGGFCSFDDWSEYMEYNLSEHIRNADRIFKENGALQPTINEMLPGIGNGIDPWKLAKCTDIVGVSLFGKPSRHAALCMNVSSSIAKANNKSIFVVEAGGGSIKFDDPNPFAASGFTPSAAELKTSMLMRAGFGAKGIMYWCWRARLSDIEGNDFGMCRPDGKPLKRTRELGRFAKVMESHSSVYNRSARKADVAIFMSQKITHIMDGDRMRDNYLNAVYGAFGMVTDLHINADFISDEQVINGLLTQYKVLLLPCTYIISEECASAITAFVKHGGTVIADYILAEKRPGGFCYTTLPGAGFDSLFGIEREDVLYIAHPVMERENQFGIAVGSIVEELILQQAQSIGGEYMPGYPLISKNQYENGEAIYIATQFFAKYETKPALCMREVLQQMLSEKGITAHTVLSNEDLKPQSKLVTTALYDNEHNMTVLTVSNTDYETVHDTLLLPSATYESIGNDGKCMFLSENGAVKAEFTLDAMESVAIIQK